MQGIETRKIGKLTLRARPAMLDYMETSLNVSRVLPSILEQRGPKKGTTSSVFTNKSQSMGLRWYE